MIGTNAITGEALGGIEHCKQSIVDILTTPKGSRVMRRTYGSDLFSLTDLPMNQDTRMRMIAATADALALWEPRVQVTAVKFTVNANGQQTIDLTANYLPDGVAIQIDGIVIS